jgi:hypothetical protein
MWGVVGAHPTGSRMTSLYSRSAQGGLVLRRHRNVTKGERGASVPRFTSQETHLFGRSCVALLAFFAGDIAF